MKGRRGHLDSGVYVHVPFCLSKCTYCAFNSVPSACGVPDSYVESLVKDAEIEARRWVGTRFRSVFVGGGTPSLLTGSQLGHVFRSLREYYAFVPAPEITIECNPQTLTYDKIACFRHLGIGRLSIGVQSLSERELKVLGRTHSPEDAKMALVRAGQAGFESVSADVILGIPGQSSGSMLETLRVVADHAHHVSVYLLSVEEGASLQRMVAEGLVTLPSESAVLELLSISSAELAKRGFRRYETSNWSLPGHRCLHNMIYWQRGDYAGIGAGAHSHRDGVRYARIADPGEYDSCLALGHDPVEMREILSRDQIMLEDIMLSLRTAGGLDLASLSARYDIDVDAIDAVLAGLVSSGHVVSDGSRLRISTKGVAIQDSITAAVAAAAIPA